MKTILKLTALLLTLAVAFSSCKEKDPPPKPFLTVDETPIFATAEGGTYTIAVSSNGEWAAVVEDAEDHAWLTLTNATGRNDGTITVDVSENTDILSRSAVVKISLENFTKSVVINQDANEDTLTGPPKTIIGKWEFVAMERLFDQAIQEFEAIGYYEYFSNGRMVVFDYRTEKYSEGTYTLEIRKNNGNIYLEEEYWHLSALFPGDEEPWEWACKFRSEDEKALFPFHVLPQFYYLEIYRRKK